MTNAAYKIACTKVAVADLDKTRDMLAGAMRFPDVARRYLAELASLMTRDTPASEDEIREFLAAFERDAETASKLLSALVPYVHASRVFDPPEYAETDERLLQ